MQMTASRTFAHAEELLVNKIAQNGSLSKPCAWSQANNSIPKILQHPGNNTLIEVIAWWHLFTEKGVTSEITAWKGTYLFHPLHPNAAFQEMGRALKQACIENETGQFPAPDSWLLTDSEIALRIINFEFRKSWSKARISFTRGACDF